MSCDAFDLAVFSQIEDSSSDFAHIENDARGRQRLYSLRNIFCRRRKVNPAKPIAAKAIVACSEIAMALTVAVVAYRKMIFFVPRDTNDVGCFYANDVDVIPTQFNTIVGGVISGVKKYTRTIV